MELLEGYKKLSGISHGKPVRRTTPLKAYQPLNETKIDTVPKSVSVTDKRKSL